MPAPTGYIDVATRISEFRAKHPEGSLRLADPSHPFQIVTVGDATYIVVCAAAFRTPDDQAPGIGTAWERVPGLTNFTLNSELQNAETSAWGRAIIAVGAADSKQGVATAEDVAWRNAEADKRAEDEAAIPGLRTAIDGSLEKLTDAQKADVKAWMAEQNLPAVRRMNADQCNRMIDHLMSIDDAGVSPAVAADGTPTEGERL